MEYELWWLLAFPLFFALGWVAARVDIRHVVRESRELPRSYFAGLNFLVNEQPDKAIEAFIEAVKVDPETIEVHFALGSLFRRRGETDRAIRMHQNVLDRDELPDDQRLQALSELGQDYLKAGLLDRAEETFHRLRGSPLNEDALRYLLEIYQQEKDWQKAINAAQELPDHAGHLWAREIANFYCERAAVALAESNPTEAERHLDHAHTINRRCVRATLLLGDIRAAAGDLDAALTTWKRIEQQDPVYLALAAPRIADAHRRLGRERQGLQLLRGYLERQPSLDLLDTVFQWELDLEGADAACRLVRNELRRNPTLLGLGKLLEALVLISPTDARQDLELMKDLIHAHTRRVARYRCDNCGFKARQFYWRCPACGGWETYPPRRTEEYDLGP
ncbi:MAG: lipopolysaccharide assembly protein LapB [Betaproteobacteria bacterium]|nr:lipopolysaccharide assembly protein LapB [Betaproteobacteria bacterium]